MGVARQYLGSIGKVDNGQVGVFVALCQEDDVCLTDSRLYLPETWIKDTSRCKKAGIPKEAQKYKTKPELALDMIESFGGRVNYEWVGGDSIYGNSPKLREGLQALDKLYVMDVSENFLCYSQHPTPYVPGSKSMGRKKSSYISDFSPLKAKGLFAQIPPGDWKPLTVRTGTKGPLKRKVVVKPIFSWSAKRPTTEKVEKLRLVISCNEDGSEVKYSITNDCGLSRGSLLSDCGLLYRQMQRYWVERGFQDCKDVLGMTEYQVRGWRAWHHHITLTIMAYHFMVSQKVMHQQKIPLMSCADIKFFMALTLPKKADNPEKLWELINTRHRDRQKDIDRYLSP